MALKHVNAVVVGAGAGGGIVAKELSSAGLSVVLLERGKWYTPFDDRKDDLHNQRTTVLGAAFGPDEERNPRVFVDVQGLSRWCDQATVPTTITPRAWEAELSAMGPWRGGLWSRTSVCGRPTARSKAAR